MGLDWNPGLKAKTGHHVEFVELWRKLHARSCFFRSIKARRFREITTSAFETLNAPRVGFDERANEWARLQAFPRRGDKRLTEETFIRQMHGFYVLDLVSACDGLPRYSNGNPGGYVERYAFRGQYLKDCTDIIGKELLESAYISKLPAETMAYGDDLLQSALRIASMQKIDLNGLGYPEDEDSIEFHLDVVLSAAKWCKYWAERGHWLEAYC